MQETTRRSKGLDDAVPPDIRILTPGLRFFSTSNVRTPRWAAVAAAIKPAAPAPTTINS